MKTECFRIRLKPGRLDRVRAWAAEINKRADEAVSTLQQEGVHIESVFLDRLGGTDYLVYYMRAEDFEAARMVAARSQHEIDAYHTEFKRDCWEEGDRLELLVDLTNPRRLKSRRGLHPLPGTRQ